MVTTSKKETEPKDTTAEAEVISFLIPGTPVGKGRPRFVRATGRTYTPDRTANYENLVKLCYMEATEGRRFADDAQLLICIDAFFEIPKSARKKDIPLMMDGRIRPTKKPDADNILKAICDALNGIAYKDDSQIAEVRLSKFYWNIPQTAVEIRKLHGGTNDADAT